MTFGTTPSSQESSNHHEPGDSPQPADPVRVRRSRWRLVGISVVLVVTVAAFSWFTRSSDTASTTVEENVTAVQIDVAAGDIEITRDDGQQVWFESRADDGWVRSASVQHEIDGATLRITGSCEGRFIPAIGCQTDVTVTVPDGIEVVAKTASGTVEAAGLTRSTELESGAGDVAVTDQAGELRARATSGDIDITNLTSTVAHASSHSGDVTVHAVRPPRSLDAESSAGDVSVTLPTGRTYAVESSSRGGEVVVGADANVSSLHKVRAFSTDGDVTVSAE